MKRTLVAAAGMSLALACAPAIAQTPGAMKVTLAGGSVGGAWSAIGTAIGETLRREYPNTSFTYEPGREQSNILLVSQGRVQLGIAHAQFANRAKNGADPFKQPVDNVRAIAMIDPQAAMQIFVREGSGIESLEQVRKEKKPVRVAANLRGTMMAIAAEELLDAYGIAPNELEAWGGRIFYASFNDGLEMMKNKQADMIVNLLAYPSSQLTTATREMPVKMLGVNPDATAKLDRALGTVPVRIPAKTYEFQPAPVDSVTATVVLFASASMSDEDATKVVAAMLKHFEYLKQAHAMMRDLDPGSLAKVAPLQLHPGAEKAYRAAGVLK